MRSGTALLTFVRPYATISVMIAYLLYNRGTAAEGRVADLARRLEPLQVEYKLVDADSPEGINLAEDHDLLGRPAVILARSDGSPVQTWEGEELPTPADISYLAHQ